MSPRLPGRGGMAGIAAVAALGMSSCGGTGEYPPPPAVVQVSMDEYRFAYEPPRSPGRIVFDARNDGRVDHQLVLIHLPEGVPSIDRQLRSKDRKVVPTVATLAAREPGRRGTFAVDLDPGRYALVCFVNDPDGQHAQKGMSAEFRIRS